MNYQAVLFLWIIGGIAAVIGMVLFFVRRKENRRLAEIKEVKDTFAKRVGIPQKYAKAYEDATTERDIIDVAIIIAQSHGVWGTSAHLAVFLRGVMPFGKVMRSLAVDINNADKNTEANHGAKEAGFPTPIFREKPVSRPWYENYTDSDQGAARRTSTGTNSVTEHRHQRHYRDDYDDYTLPVAAAAFSAFHSSPSCNTTSYESNHACERPSSGGYGSGESSDGGGGSSCGDSGGGGD